MKVKKIVDTVVNYGRAEQFIDLEADFKRFLRSKFAKKEFNDLDPEQIAQKHGLKGFVFGNYTTQEERYFAMFKFKYQLEALAALKGSNKLSDGDLIIAFGAEGMPKANAHYNPQKQLININRGSKGSWKDSFKGENSLVHEYGHYLDFKAGRADKAINVNFASEIENADRSVSAKTRTFSSVVDSIQGLETYMSRLDTAYLNKRIEIFARYFETAVYLQVVENLPDYLRYFDRHYKDDVYLSKKEITNLKLNNDCIRVLRTL